MCPIHLLVLDVDGVLTDGRFWFDAQGNEHKMFHSQDGQGIRNVMKAGIEVAVISGRNSPDVARRMAELDVKHVFQGVHNKLDCCNRLLASLGRQYSETAIIGDDVADLDIMSRSALPIAVQNAQPCVLSIAQLITVKHGGMGAVREACEFILAHHHNPASK